MIEAWERIGELPGAQPISNLTAISHYCLAPLIPVKSDPLER